MYAWLELISHRIFIARMLAHTPQQKVGRLNLLNVQNTLEMSITMFLTCLHHVLLQGWPMYAQLLIDLFKFLAPFLRNVELNKPMQILYKVQKHCFFHLNLRRIEVEMVSPVFGDHLHVVNLSRAPCGFFWSCCMTSQSSCAIITMAFVT